MSVDAAADEQFGPYLVYERLGVGGMATVHRALEQGAEGFERMVALKRLLPHLAEDASFIKSFVREAKLASILNHVNIVQIYELGRVGTEYFISMEYIDGRDLRRVLRHARKVTGPPPINITVALLVQLCDALDYAHNKVDDDGHPLGLVHRDISPSNLLITSGGHLKIIDFGIAKAQSSQLRTQTGRVKGKLAYMAPEAVSGSRDLDSRSDIWACGVILHELLTARPLFASKNEYQTLLKVQRGDIMPPSTFNQGCPPELDAIVFRALARDPDDRFASAGELREALQVLRRQYALHTGFRDIASWLDWAFGLEAPQSFTHTDSSGVSSPDTPRRQKTPRPHRTTEEDEAVEVVWGGGNVESEDGPLVLEDVPDVSGKHPRARRDTDDDSASQDDDIPTPLPSHGTMPSIYGAEPIVPKPRTKDPAIPAIPVGRGSDQMRAQSRSTSAPHTIPRTTRPTSPGIVGARPTDRMQPQKAAQTGPIRVDAPQLGDRMAAQRARESGAPENVASAKGDSGRITNPEAQRLRTDPDGLSDEDLFGVEAAAALARISEEIDVTSLSTAAPPAQDDDETTLEPSSTPVNPLPVVRFSKAHSIPPANLPALADPNRPPPSTKPGIAPVRAITAPSAAAAATAPAAAPAAATAPGVAAVAAAAAAPEPVRPRRVSNVRIGETIAARGIKPKRTWLAVLGAIVLVGGAATAVTVLMQHDKPVTPSDSSSTTTPPSPTLTGTVKFVTEPADAEIRIGGQPAHDGSPWSQELAAGVHQIEIHRKGYKSWLTSLELSSAETQTLRVVLEPLTTKESDATLTITTTPDGLEVIIDGKVQPQRTPYKGPLKVGAHKIVVRQDGVEVWHQTLDAESSSDYAFNPSFTEDKQRERAQRVPAPPAKASTPQPTPTPTTPSDAKPDHQDPSPTWIKPGSSATPPTPTAVPAVIAPNEKPPASPITAPHTATTAPAPPPAAAATTPPAPSSAKPTPAPAQAPKQVTTSVAPAPAPAAPPKRPTAPVIVPPNVVKKLSGEPPSIAKFKNVELPSSLAAKVCIDETGKVTNADMVTKVTSRVAGDLTETLRTWRYAPHKVGGQAVPACFVVTFRAK